MTASNPTKTGHPDQLGGDGMTLDKRTGSRMSSMRVPTGTQTDIDVADPTGAAVKAMVAAGRAHGMTDEAILSAAIKAIHEAAAPTSRRAREWAPPEHPYGLCSPSRCLVEPRIDQNGRAVGNLGYHRASVVTVQAEFADAIEVGVGVSEDVLGVNLDDAVVHVRAIDQDEEVDDVPWYVALSEDEAEALGKALLSRASLLRAIKQRHAREAAEQAAEQAIREKFPNAPANIEDWDKWPPAHVVEGTPAPQPSADGVDLPEAVRRG